MKKIAFFMHNFNGGGAEKVTLNLAKLLVEKGYSVSFVMKNINGPLYNEVPKNIAIVDLSIKNSNRMVANIHNVKKIVKILKNNEYDVMISVCRHMNLIAGISMKFSSKSKTKLYGTVHNSICNEKVSFQILRNMIMRTTHNKFEKIIVVSEEARKEYCKKMKIVPEKTITIYNPVTSEEIFEKQKERIQHKWLYENRDFPVLLNVGRWTYQKNQELLIRQMKLINEKTKAKLILLGEGEDEKELKKNCSKLGLENIIDFVPFVINPYPYMAHSDLLVMSSRYEGLPTVIIEALACGLNVVSMDCPTGPKEILQEGKYGYLVENGNERDFSKTVINTLRQKKEKDFLRQRAMDFSYEKSIEKYITLIEEDEH